MVTVYPMWNDMIAFCRRVGIYVDTHVLTVYVCLGSVMHICLFTWMLLMCLNVGMCIRMYVCARVGVFACKRIPTHIPSRMHIQTRLRACKQNHAPTHTHTRSTKEYGYTNRFVHTHTDFKHTHSFACVREQICVHIRMRARGCERRACGRV